MSDPVENDDIAMRQAEALGEYAVDLLLELRREHRAHEITRAALADEWKKIRIAEEALDGVYRWAVQNSTAPEQFDQRSAFWRRLRKIIRYPERLDFPWMPRS